MGQKWPLPAELAAIDAELREQFLNWDALPWNTRLNLIVTKHKYDTDPKLRNAVKDQKVPTGYEK